MTRLNPIVSFVIGRMGSSPGMVGPGIYAAGDAAESGEGSHNSVDAGAHVIVGGSQ